MSVESFNGDGLPDQPSIVYGFEKDDDGEVEIRDLARSGFGEPGPLPGGVIERETIKSNLTLRAGPDGLPGSDRLQEDECGEDIPEFACLGHDADNSAGCGKPIYVGQTCSSPACERDWPTAVKRKVVRTAGKLEGFRRSLYSRYNGQKGIVYFVYPLAYCCRNSNDPAKARLTYSVGSTYLYIPYIVRREYSRSSETNGGRNRTTTTSTLTWPVNARRGSRTCCFFGNRNKRLAFGSGYAGCRVPLAGRS